MEFKLDAKVSKSKKNTSDFFTSVYGRNIFPVLLQKCFELKIAATGCRQEIWTICLLVFSCSIFFVSKRLFFAETASIFCVVLGLEQISHFFRPLPNNTTVCMVFWAGGVGGVSEKLRNDSKFDFSFQIRLSMHPCEHLHKPGMACGVFSCTTAVGQLNSYCDENIFVHPYKCTGILIFLVTLLSIVLLTRWWYWLTRKHYCVKILLYCIVAIKVLTKKVICNFEKEKSLQMWQRQQSCDRITSHQQKGLS